MCMSYLLNSVLRPHRVLYVFSQPTHGIPIQGKNVVICKYPSDPSVVLGILSVVALLLSAIVGHVAVYFPYKGKSVPSHALFRSAALLVFFIIAE